MKSEEENLKELEKLQKKHNELTEVCKANKTPYNYGKVIASGKKLNKLIKKILK